MSRRRVAIVESLLRCCGGLFTLGDSFIRRGSALGKEIDAFEKVHGAIKLGVTRMRYPRAILFIKALKSARHALEQDVALFLIGDGDEDVGGDPLFVDNLVAG